MTPNQFCTQTNIVLACVALYNFLQLIVISNELFIWFNNKNVELEDICNDQ